MAGLMELRRRLILSNMDGLPPIYTQVDYLQTTGGKARIDTGIAGNDSTIQLQGDVKSMDFGAYNACLGNHVGDGYRAWRIIQPSSNSQKSIICGTYKNNGTNPTFDSNIWQNIPLRFQFDLSFGHAVITINGETKTATGNDSGLPNNNANIAIGSRNPSVASGTARHRFYWVKIWTQGALVRDYIPCIRKSDSKVGFYDKVNGTFNPSTGTEEFVAGND